MRYQRMAADRMSYVPIPFGTPFAPGGRCGAMSHLRDFRLLRIMLAWPSNADLKRPTPRR
jgi:hypothetical protein